MDVVRTKKDRTIKERIVQYKWPMLVLSILICSVWLFFGVGERLPEQRGQALVIEQVRQGTLKVNVEGYGTLRSNNQKLLTSYTQATVEEIVLRPGAQVAQGSVILKMSNPQIDRELALAKQQLEAEKTVLEQVKINNEQDVSERVISLVQLKSQFELAKLQEKAMAKLFKQGIVSELTYTEAKLTAEQLEEHLTLLNKSLESLEKVNRKKVQIQEKFISQREIDYQMILNNKEKLTVTANEAGILQELYVELGQSVAPGEQLLMIGVRKDLLGLLKVPQSKVGLIALGQQASLKVGSESVRARVHRIDPAIEDSTVTVELLPLEELPENARPNLRVDGTIYIREMPDVLYVKKPTNVRSNSTQGIFVLDNESEIAKRTPIKFGADSGQFIEIKSGIAAGQSVILSDMSKLSSSDSVRIIF
ncbi:efflux RND transporter periplasmic adaptor subunit [Alteromonas sp. ASW11-130]|uniref:efflux RND transporter periplasmic adaptor subunit n=1 Tax=Alteromonas sp. ASW11-130 TaxID=3015775 RepID=UPI002241F34B|nr:efflux RND transporter periplasmic adaptor subunit [Alteromonas sp. ASW11-130]MCW8092494.1 efflux RND transporter periplasmic adaptor subunit [Alteromonas sp. ASW11-130]